MSIHLDRFNRNLARVDSLCGLFEQTKQSTHRATVKEADILRAAVVFLHSALEDYLRGVITEWLPQKGSTEALNKIALLGTEGRSDKFSLGALVAFKEMNIADLLGASVEQQMKKVSFNNFTDINHWTEKIGISLREYKAQETITLMITRRHKIVHEADANRNSGSGNHYAASISLKTVKVWKAAVVDLVNLIDTQIVNFKEDEVTNGAYL